MDNDKMKKIIKTYSDQLKSRDDDWSAMIIDNQKLKEENENLKIYIEYEGCVCREMEEWVNLVYGTTREEIEKIFHDEFNIRREKGNEKI